jgi:hypothetical protein
MVFSDELLAQSTYRDRGEEELDKKHNILKIFLKNGLLWWVIRIEYIQGQRRRIGQKGTIFLKSFKRWSSLMIYKHRVHIGIEERLHWTKGNNSLKIF